MPKREVHLSLTKPASRYGRAFDQLAEEWARLENEHDKMHPDRSECGGVGGCPMMRERVDNERWLMGQLDLWRAGKVGVR